MNWLTSFVRPKIKALIGDKPDIPDDLWHKCPSCGQMIFHRDLKKNLHVCQHCNHHMRLPIIKRLESLFDDGEYKRISLPETEEDPLKFKDRKRYSDRIKEARAKTNEKDAIIVAHGEINGQNAVIAAFNFNFMGGSMGTAVGEGIVAAAHLAVVQEVPLIVIPASGGARMQESILSLMQMPRTTIAIQQLKEANLPYIVILTDPTTGGVSASFAMLGDIQIAEPGCMIGFAGRRVIEQTVRETLPDGFQTAEYLHQHGMVDMVIDRSKLKATVARIIDMLRNPKPMGKVIPISKAMIEENLEIPEQKIADNPTIAEEKFINPLPDDPKPKPPEKPVDN